MLKKIQLSDNQGRVLLKTKGDRVLVGRYTDLNIKTKETIAEFFMELTGEDSSRVMDFLDFKNEDVEFCS